MTGSVLDFCNHFLWKHWMINVIDPAYLTGDIFSLQIFVFVCLFCPSCSFFALSQLLFGWYQWPRPVSCWMSCATLSFNVKSPISCLHCMLAWLPCLCPSVSCLPAEQYISTFTLAVCLSVFDFLLLLLFCHCKQIQCS